MQQIKTATLDNDNLLLIVFTKQWDLDDINFLSECVFKQLPDYQLKERVQGADREYFRFTYNNAYLILHFESYSESCWIEPEDQLENQQLMKISSLLNS
ncbi:DUF3630 family protein [Thalassotalea nanhaiensis]|uniref:DUF3630 family protein n=1 Tax=Thalassotalea nanhaiensis TaxID=3065648 RepID=A0ABY9THS1_9GAMM|nr:DUF3630 family protein [Colwelliaceae bacterium SQ345]